MATEKIKNLLDKYFEGETSLDEEKILKNYFLDQRHIAEEFKSFAHLFTFIEEEKKITAPKLELTLQPKLKTKKFSLSSSKWKVAASAAILIVAGFFVTKQFKTSKPLIAQHNKARIRVYDVGDNPEEALNATLFALNKASHKLNKGKTAAEESLLKIKKSTSIFK